MHKIEGLPYLTFYFYIELFAKCSIILSDSLTKSLILLQKHKILLKFFVDQNLMVMFKNMHKNG